MDSNASIHLHSRGRPDSVVHLEWLVGERPVFRQLPYHLDCFPINKSISLYCLCPTKWSCSASPIRVMRLWIVSQLRNGSTRATATGTIKCTLLLQLFVHLFYWLLYWCQHGTISWMARQDMNTDAEGQWMFDLSNLVVRLFSWFIGCCRWRLLSHRWPNRVRSIGFGHGIRRCRQCSWRFG